MIVKLQIDIEITRETGKFASREELEQLLIDAIEDPGSIDTDEGATYNVDSFEVYAIDSKPPKKTKGAAAR